MLENVVAVEERSIKQVSDVKERRNVGQEG